MELLLASLIAFSSAEKLLCVELQEILSDEFVDELFTEEEQRGITERCWTRHGDIEI